MLPRSRLPVPALGGDPDTSRVCGPSVCSVVRASRHAPRHGVHRDGDWFGATVNLAARISGLAHGGEVLLTDATRQSAEDIADVRFEAHGVHHLRNVARPVKVFAAVAVSAVRSQLVIDPVCRMAVNPNQATGRLAHEGRDYHFCSLECAARFAADPEVYAKSEPLTRG